VIEIHERYKSFVPPSWFRPTVERLMMSLPSNTLAGCNLSSSQTRPVLVREKLNESRVGSTIAMPAVASTIENGAVNRRGYS
jgi:hypothetical protein